MRNRIRYIILSITIAFLLVGLLPYKIPQFNIKNKNELTIENGHEIKKLNWNLLKVGNRFVITGTVVGVDSVGANPNVPCNVKAIVRIDEWSPNRYNVNLLSYDTKWLIPYSVTGSILIVLSIIALLWKKK